MNYRSRTSRIKSLAHTNNDSIYWSAIDTFSNVTDPTRSVSRQSLSASRNYIDPWDLENYAYIQSLQSDEPSGTPSSIHDDMTTQQYYAQNSNTDECPCYAGLDEQLFYNAKYEMPDDGSFTDVEDASSNSYSGSTVSTLQLKNGPHINFPPPPLHPSSAYECYANIIVPNQVSPPSNGVQYDSMGSGSMNGLHYPSSELIYESLPIDYPSSQQQQYYYDPYSEQYKPPPPARRRSIRDPCYECLEMQNMPLYYAPSNLREQYDSIHSEAVDYQRGSHLERFGLSKKGLLQIDYSLSWSNLQRFIASK